MIYSFLTLWLSSALKILNNRNLLFTLLICFIQFFLLFNSEGTDWDTYKHYVYNPSANLYFEPGFSLLIIISRALSSFNFILLIISFLFLFGISSFKNKYNFIPNWLIILSIFPIFLPLFSGALRQALALCLIIVGFSRKSFFPFILVASFFHYSALLFLPVYLLKKFKIKERTKLIVLIFGLMAFLVISYRSPLIYLYLKSGDFYIQEGTVGGFKDVLIVIERILLLLAGILTLKKIKKASLRTFAYVTILGSLIFLIFYSEFRNFAGRALAILRVFDLIILYIFFSFWFGKIKQKKKLIYILIFSYSLLKFMITSSS